MDAGGQGGPARGGRADAHAHRRGGGRGDGQRRTHHIINPLLRQVYGERSGEARGQEREE